MDWVHFIDDDDFGRPTYTDRIDAFNRVAGALADGANAFEVTPGPDLREINRAVGMLRALVVDGIASVRPGPDRRSARALLTLTGRRLALGSAAGGIALFPSRDPVKVIARPPGIEPDADPAMEFGPTVIMAVAPDWFDEDTQSGSAVPVILDPLPSWASHPVYTARHGGPDVASAAWEVFTLDGEGHGLLLMTESGFFGVECGGPVSSAPTAGAAAWEIVVNK